MDYDNRNQNGDVNSSTEGEQTEQKENVIVEKDQDPSYDTSYSCLLYTSDAADD